MHIKSTPKDHSDDLHCCVEVGTPPHLVAYREGRYGDGAQFCRKTVTVEIDGKNYCRGHAGQLALEHLIEGTKDDG